MNTRNYRAIIKKFLIAALTALATSSCDFLSPWYISVENRTASPIEVNITKSSASPPDTYVTIKPGYTSTFSIDSYETYFLCLWMRGHGTPLAGFHIEESETWVVRQNGSEYEVTRE